MPRLGSAGRAVCRRPFAVVRLPDADMGGGATVDFIVTAAAERTFGTGSVRSLLAFGLCGPRNGGHGMLHSSETRMD